MSYWGHFYPKAIANLFGGEATGEDRWTDFMSDTIKAAPLESPYLPLTTHELYSDLTNEIAANQKTLAGKSVVYTAATKLIEFKCSAISWPLGFNLGDLARYLALWNDTHASKPLLGYVDLGAEWIGTNFIWNQITSLVQFVVDAYDPAGSDFNWYWYGKALANALGGESAGEDRHTNWTDDDLRIAILDDTYTPDQDADEVWADVSAHEISGTGYAAGGNGFLSQQIRVHPTIKRTEFCGEDVFWSLVTWTNGRYAVLRNATHADGPLLGFTDFRANRSPNNEEFRIKFPPGYQGGGILGANPILQITVS